ncbi:hypothetical protein AGMMS50284_6970 [Clostridia bacterium]|nr:hypothetical protein AGMMS50284_6970 [Clostridia bacterium]
MTSSHSEKFATPTDDEVFSKYIISLHKLASIIKLRQNFVADAKFDIETALAIEFAKRFGAAEENAFLNGNGVNEPTGILNDTSGAEVCVCGL